MYKKILLPVDVFEMDLSDKAVRHAEFLASAEEGEITLLKRIAKQQSFGFTRIRCGYSEIRNFYASGIGKENADAVSSVLDSRCANSYPGSIWQCSR